MFEMWVLCCKLHRNLMIHENVMLQLHGETHTKWVFSNNPHVFTILHFLKKCKGIAQRNNCQSWEYDGFYNTWEACALMKKTLPAVSESTRFSAILRETRRQKRARTRGRSVVVVVVVVVVAVAVAVVVVVVVVAVVVLLKLLKMLPVHLQCVFCQI